MKPFYSILCRIILAAVLFTLPVFPAFSHSGLQQDQTDRVNDILNQMQQEMQNSDTVPDSIVAPPPIALQQALDDSTIAMYQKAMQAYYEYRVSGFEHRKNVFLWQLVSSKMIFFGVLLMVFCGICFSGIQFYKSMTMSKVEGVEAIDTGVTEFEASTSGIKVTSSVLGIIVLVISLAFFYLYLVYVYPISEIF
ncbi:hypothetical protein [Rhodohalobacter sp.]|uniref:hypothetical protein n=1 Tax=Rhodohalobacter sp. TaxID=1974210 RepID=UPI002ACD664F|nr:hypothetical protein [Rhodohalobacter sp.]MDZ7757700.1 hypothetical protein [Rhodohalobacter sp.]